MSIEYRHNTSSQLDILYHLQNVSSAFVHDLSNRVDVKEYSQKLFSMAEREEAWSGDNLIGLVAYYINHDTQKVFITNVSVDIRFQKQGIATTLLENVKCAAVNERMNFIFLEVAQDERLMDFYRHNGFVEEKQIPNGNKILIKNLVPIVVIRCTVYNHEPYLRDCLEGFVMQKTNFPFVAIVHDDASTDGSAAIIREYEEKYPDIIKPIYEKENQWRKGTLTKVMNAAIEATGAKYVAMCEGDDYWTDPLKLQKQVDFMEENPEYDMVCARFNHLVHETGEIQQYDLYDSIIQSQEDGVEIKQEHFVSFAQPHPCTVMFRTGTLTDHPIIPKLKYRFDIPVYYCFLYLHRVWLMNEKMAVYRKHKGSLTVSGETENWSLAASHKELLSHFPNDPNLKQLVQQDYRKYIIKESDKKDYTIKQFILHLLEYIKHRPKFRNIISLVVKIIKIRIKLLKNHE